MDFSYMGGNDFGTDQISSSTLMNYDMNDIFVTQPKINKQLQWPVPKHKYPDPVKKEKLVMSRQKNKMEGFTRYGSGLSTYDDHNQITENMLIILLLVIVIVMCAMIYSTVKQTCETLKLMVSILASSSQK